MSYSMLVTDYGLIQKTRISFLRVCVDEKKLWILFPWDDIGNRNYKAFFF